MKALRSVPLLTLLALTSCGIPATGVVEAGGPASGTLPMTRVYFVENGALVATSRTTELPGDPEAALQLLMAGPLAGEKRSGRLSSEVPGVPTAMALPPATDEPTMKWMLKYAGKAVGLPADMAAQHDHYIHGTPKR